MQHWNIINNRPLIRVTPSLCFKARLSAKKMIFYSCANETHYTRPVLYLASFWKSGTLELRKWPFFLMSPWFNRWLRCVPDVWSLSEWSNWKTPASLPRQYDTMFFTCFIDKEPAVHVDKQEMMHSMVIIHVLLLKFCFSGIDWSRGKSSVFFIGRGSNLDLHFSIEIFHSYNLGQNCWDTNTVAQQYDTL